MLLTEQVKISMLGYKQFGLCHGKGCFWGENECFSRLNKEGSCGNLIKEGVFSLYFYKLHKTLLKDISKSQHGQQ